MNFLHYPLNLSSGDTVEVILDREANVRLLDEANFAKYQQGEQHTYYGGLAKKSPVRIRAPHPGSWHLVIDLGGYAGTVKASVKTIKG
jgi:hypothetical protein